jgi:DNA-binding response OmpR family regulator
MNRGDAGTGVIVGENDTLMRGIIRSVLVQVEPQVFPAANGLEALILAQQFRARLVLLDIGMPRLNGLLACEAIRALPGYADVPVVMLTGYDDARLREAAWRLGARDFITKPFRPDLLLARLAPYLGVPARAAAADANAVMPGGRSKAHDTPGNPHPLSGDRLDVIDGREMIRICRKAERG